MQWDSAREQEIDLANPREVEEIRSFLAGFGLDYQGDVDYTMALYDDEHHIIGTGSLLKNVLRNIAVDEEHQGEGLTAVIVSQLLREAASHGYYHYFLFTKPSRAVQFSALGFKEIARVEPLAVLLEMGVGSIERFAAELREQTAKLPAGRRAALVVNCNPFTLGHEAVISKASRENDAVVVLVVSEDQSCFPFEARIRLVREGLKKYENVLVLPSGPYVISAATFPGYFTQGQDTVLAQTRLDANVFVRWIAPALGVTRRYVGEEPYSEVTRCYNEALLEVLPAHGIEVFVMPRKQAADDIISASKVRRMLSENDWQGVRRLVPDTTYAYLTSKEAEPVLKRLKAACK